METQPHTPVRLAFGPFEVDTEAGVVFRSRIRVRLSGQPLRILLELLANPGSVVTRGQLRDRIWAQGTFVDFERGMNAAINKLRRALSDSADNPRYIETVPGRGYRFIGTLERRAATPVPPAVDQKTGEESPTRVSVSFWWWVAPLAAGLILFGASRLLQHSPLVAPLPWKLVRLATRPGLAKAPALSPDGKLVAYSSDPGAVGMWDLYVQQLGGSQSIRLTFDGAGDTTPDFSPDGSKIVFRSNRLSGGIYEIPALGGEAQLLARDGLNPKFSPDGSQVAYWIGTESVAASVPGSGAVWVVTVAGGQPQRVGPRFTSARYPIWSPDGKYLLLIGYTSPKAFDNSAIDWWLVAADGKHAVKTAAVEALVKGGLQAADPGRNTLWRVPVPSVPRPGCWSAADTVTFSAPTGDTQNLWEIGVSSQTGKVSGAPRRLTTGAGSETDPSCGSGGGLAFTNLDVKREVWSLPFDLDRGKSRGALERIMERSANRENPSLSQDRRYLAFTSDQSGRSNIWVRDLRTGKETHLAPSTFVERYPAINASGSQIAFSSYENDKRVVYLLSLAGGPPVKLCEDCLRATDWSRDEKTLLIVSGSPYQISALSVASHEQEVLLRHRDYNLLYGHFSPDNRWVSFTERIEPNRGRIMIAPLNGPKPVPESAWITIAEVGADDYANWSPDGKVLYFTSSTDGHNCLWGQRIKMKSSRPVGDPFVAQHFHTGPSFEHGGWSAVEGRIVLSLVESASDIWTMSRAK